VLAVRPVLADVDDFLDAAERYAALGVTELEVMPDRLPGEVATEVAERVLRTLE
jgi:hypothetical protein